MNLMKLKNVLVHLKLIENILNHQKIEIIQPYTNIINTQESKKHIDLIKCTIN